MSVDPKVFDQLTLPTRRRGSEMFVFSGLLDATVMWCKIVCSSKGGPESSRAVRTNVVLASNIRPVANACCWTVGVAIMRDQIIQGGDIW